METHVRMSSGLDSASNGAALMLGALPSDAPVREVGMASAGPAHCDFCPEENA